MSPWTIYWITRLDDIRLVTTSSLAVLGMAGGISLVFLFFLWLAAEDDKKYVDEWNRVKKKCKFPLFLFACTYALLIFAYIGVPTTKQAAAIYCIPKIINNEQIQDETKEIYDLAKIWLKQQVEDKEPVGELPKDQ